MNKERIETKWRLFSCSVLAGLAVLALLGGGASGAAPPETDSLPFVSPIFGDSMVLQREKPNPVWGWSQPGDTVRVEIGDNSASATAGADGRWQTQIQPPPPGGPYTVRITGRQTVELHDVLVGDVWICSGQSNMQFGLAQARNGAEEIKDANHPEIRYYTVRQRVSYTHVDAPRGTWKVVSPATLGGGPIGGISAVAYFFARKLQESVHVPIGLIQVAAGGVPAETLASPESLRAVKDFDAGLDEVEQRGQKGGPEYGNYIMHWYDEYDVGTKNGSWADPQMDDSSWKSVRVPGRFEELGVADVPSLIWLRKEITLPETPPPGPARLLLGSVEKMDTTYVNGRQVGASSWVENPRAYFAGGALTPGRNVIAIRLFKMKRDGGFLNPAGDLRLALGDGSVIPLGGEWKGRVAVDGRPPQPLPIAFENLPSMPGVLYRGMLEPVVPLALTGAIWYQGESNTTRAYQYRKLLPALISGWRKAFGQGDFPFYIVSLPRYLPHRDLPADDDWAELREAQALTAQNVPHSCVAVTIDTGDPENIHPPDKKEVGDRLAYCALAEHYGLKVPYSGPTLSSVERLPGALKLHFDHTDGGLVVKGDKLGEFSLAGDDRKLHWADARIQGDAVIVSTASVPDPKAVRYAWQANPAATLFNGAGLPAAPFRTDDWPGAPYLDPSLSPERRAADLVSRMTLEERVLQMQSTAPAIPRLGVPAYNWWNEALHGVAQGRATVFPQAIGLAATWDTDLMYRVADIISTEARAKYNDALTRPAPSGPDARMTLPGRTAGLTYWSPNVNIFRDPRWGRGQETYGEDPHLASRMGVAFVTGMQGKDPHYLKVVSTPKHYAAHSGPEPERHAFDAKVSESDLVETYLAAFRAAVTEGKADSIMCVYNSVNGTPGCASADLLQKRLREQWGFHGYVVSDCGAVDDIYRNHKYTSTLGEAAVAAVKAGTDLTCGTEYRALVDEVKAGRITEAEIDRSLERLFVARLRLGMFDPPERVPYSKISISENDSAAHRQAARDAEREAIVLLKNEGGILPLSRSMGKIAVIGPSADDPVALLGSYNGISSKQVTPLEGIERQFSAAQVRYALGATYAASTHALIPATFLAPPEGTARGVLAEYFDNPDLQGVPKLHRLEPRAYFDMGMEDPGAVAAIGHDNYSIRWTGTLRPPATGEYELTVRTGMWNWTATARLFLDDKELTVGTGPSTQMTSTPAVSGPRRAPRARLQLEGGRKYTLRVEYRQPGSGGTFQLAWIPPAGVALAEAETLAKDSDVAIVFVGLSSELEGEEMRRVNIPGFLGGDRTSLNLPEPQEELVKAVVDTGKPVVVVLTSGSAISANYAAKHAAALLEAWYGGEEAGTAIAETLAGVNNPAGRLPVTFYESVDQLPPFTDYAMKGRTYRYFRGEPLFPFGFGLSYSSFEYSGLSAKRTQTGAEVRATARNASARDGDEVVQLYVGGGSVEEAPVRTLHGFQRIRLRAGESREVSFTLGSADLPESKVDISVGGGQPVGKVPHVTGTL